MRTWIQSHPTWNHNSQRNVIASVTAAFNFCYKFDDLDVNPIAGYEKPTATPRVTAFSPEVEQALYDAADEALGLFIKACMLTGARPYSELAKVTSDHVVESTQGMSYLLKARTVDGKHGHKTGKKTGKVRRIMLCDEIATVETWIEGRDLRWFIRKMRDSSRQRLGAPEAMRLFRQLAHALHHLHRHCGVNHADIKPANIILSNASRKLVLIDFGSAWGFERSNRRHPGDGRSDVYSAPEIMSGDKAANFRADYFSLAAVCFEVLTLQSPYDGLGGRAGLPQYAGQRNSLYVPPSQLSREQHRLEREVWKSIDALLARALSLEPDVRHDNGQAWLADWDSVLNLIQRPQPISPWARLMLKLSDWLERR